MSEARIIYAKIQKAIEIPLKNVEFTNLDYCPCPD
jgi:hypothetical protein